MGRLSKNEKYKLQKTNGKCASIRFLRLAFLKTIITFYVYFMISRLV